MPHGILVVRIDAAEDGFYRAACDFVYSVYGFYFKSELFFLLPLLYNAFFLDRPGNRKPGQRRGDRIQKRLNAFAGCRRYGVNSYAFWL